MDNDVSHADGQRETTPVIDYRVAQQREREALRIGILDAAGQMLAEEGPDALTMRRVAEKVNASTQVLYTMFGGKDGLADGLVVEGSGRMARDQAAEPKHPDPVEYLVRLYEIFLDHAIAEPNYFRVMFLNAIPGYVQSEEARSVAWRGFETTVFEAIRDCGRAGVFDAAVIDEPATTAFTLWSGLHGVICLFIGGYLRDEADARSLAIASVRCAVQGLRIDRPSAPSLRD